MSDDSPAEEGRPKFETLEQGDEKNYLEGAKFREAAERDKLRLAAVRPKFERVVVEPLNDQSGVLPDPNFVVNVKNVFFPLTSNRWFKVVKQNNASWDAVIKPLIQRQYDLLLDALADVYLKNIRGYMAPFSKYVPSVRTDVPPILEKLAGKQESEYLGEIKKFVGKNSKWGTIVTIQDLFPQIAAQQGLLTPDKLDLVASSAQENLFLSKFEGLKGIFEEETQDYLDKFEAIEGFTQPADIIAYEYSGMGLDPENTETKSNKRKSRNIDEEIQNSTKKFFKESNFDNDTLDRAYLRIHQLFVRTDEPAKTEAYTPLGSKFVDALKSRRAMDEDSESSREEEKELES